jgi:hypothetical protein
MEVGIYFVMNTVMDFRFHKMHGISSLVERLLTAQEGLCYMELVGQKTDYKHSYKLCSYITCKSAFTNMATMLNIDVTSDKFNVARISV